MKKIKINLGSHSYNVLVGSGIINRLPDELKKLKLSGKALIITDNRVYKFHKDKITKLAAGLDAPIKIIKQGEPSKSLETLQIIFKYMLARRFDRSSVVIAIGGGVIGDLAGFAASIYMRGVNYIQVPTTLLSAVDSSVGGKTAVNFEKYKNIIGSFYQPKLVLADTEFLATLPEREFISGYGEVLKYAFIAGDNFYSLVSGPVSDIQNDRNKLNKIIYESVLFKSSVVEKDEKEAGLRKILNFGHTFGHAFESAMNYRIKHGEAVILGIICALKLSKESGILDTQEFNKYMDYIDNTGVRLSYALPDKERLYNIMLSDKKNKSGRINFILLSAAGKTVLDAEVSKAKVLNAIEFAGEFTRKQGYFH
ncbi:MAG TPA: 3-dehydroquinate synthase [Ignavibacteriales bacterium]|nr:3-dehydroquinate synthase [Ignavibacteriales bacterium]